MNKLKMAVVGAGIWGMNHAQIYRAHPFCEVVGICDRDMRRAEELAGQLGVQAYGDMDEMLKRSGCDAVAIVTPDFAHADLAVKAAEAGRHILIEKPLATTREDVMRIVDAVDKSGVRCMVDLHNRWSPPFNAAYESIRAGELGEVRSGYMRLNDTKWVATDMLSWAAKSSILWFLGSHSLDTLRWLMGDEVKRVYSVSRDGVLKGLGVDTVDQYLTTLEFEHGGIAQMENGWITPNANPNVNDIKCTVTGTKGMVSLDVSHHNMIQKYTDEKVTVPDVVVQHRIFGQPRGFAFESIRSFVDCILSGEEFHVTIKDAANVSLVILAIMESARTRMPVDVRY